jgi:hypothetical protein
MEQNSSSIVDHAEPYYGERVYTGFVESIMNHLMVK